ncbi:Tad domain-containing protein [Mesobacterium pallidum]|uniref:Tad domain-containing protein n=1 Tax=Mesobacterium pallidum TaxID=2872037 RepID=UPI001EE1E8BD|nr:Tad domain-containing protein [Mesobacterium pallidum]
MNAKTPRTASFVAEEDGNVTIFSIFMMVLLLLFTGAAVDIMRFETIRTSMQSTMDRAVLAAADLDQEQEPKDVVLDYLTKAGIPSARATVWVDGEVNWRSVKSTAHTNVDTIFMQMSGYDSLYAPARAKAVERISNVEISLVLDISGSMRWNSRMDNLKPAAKAFIDKVMTSESDGVTTLNLVPYAGSVNPGDAIFDYLRGERPKLNENNGWGNGDQDAPGNSLCNNNAENADEGAADPSCQDGTNTNVANTEGFFPAWDGAIDNVVFYFDENGDGIADGRTDYSYKLVDLPNAFTTDLDQFYKGAVAQIIAENDELVHSDQFLGASIKGDKGKRKYYQVKGDQNGETEDYGPTKNNATVTGKTYSYSEIDYDTYLALYVPPVGETITEGEEGVKKNNQNVNMPSSCVEIYNAEFDTAEMPKSDDYIPHFNFWPIDWPTMDWGWCPEDDTAIQYYSDDAESLKTFIDNLRMHDGTGIHIGMKYGLALLSPDIRNHVSFLITQNLVNADFQGRPKDWDDRETEKYIVVMTDGETTEQWRPLKPKAPENGYVDLQTQGSSTYEQWRTKSTNVDLLLRQCDLAKLKGVTVFAIAFEANATGQEQMKSCASSPSHYFNVTGAEIADTFDIVARQINNLRLVQ